jgi:hypothetical protein
MKSKNLFICLLFILISFGLYGQKDIIISGIITEQTSGEVIRDANISVEKSHAVSNNYGYYSIKIQPGNYSFSVSRVGYTTLTSKITTDKDTLINIQLKPGIELNEVTVSVSQPKSKGLGNINVNMSLLKQNSLFFGERDIIKAIQFLPGVSSGMEGSSQLNIRGGTNDQTLYLMDDVPVYNQNHTFGFLSIFNSEAISNAEFYKGGVPTVYGNRLSGVVNVSLKDGNFSEHHQSLSIGVLAATVKLEGPIKKEKASYILTVRRSMLDLIYNAGLYLSDKLDAYSTSLIAFHDINAKITARLTPSTKLSWQLFNGYDDLYVINKGYRMDDSQYKERFGQGWTTTTSSVRLTTRLKPNLFLTNSVYYSNLTNAKTRFHKEDMISVEQNNSSILNEVGIRSSLEYKLNNKNSLLSGFDVSDQIYNPNRLIEQFNDLTTNYQTRNQKLISAAAFISDEYKSERWNITGGLRAAFYSNYATTVFAVDPRLKISMFMNETNKFMLAYDRMHQPIHSIYEMNYSVQSDFWVPFRENSIPVSDQISVGWKNYLLNGLSVSIEAYYKKMQNLISIKNLENYLDFHTDYSVGSGTSKGIEILLEYTKNKFNSTVAYTLCKSERSFEGVTYPFKYDAPNQFSGMVSYEIKKTAKIKNTFSVNILYKTGYPYYISTAKYPLQSLSSTTDTDIDYIPQYPNIRLKNYFRTDLNYTCEKKLSKGSRVWQFSLLNATAHQNPYVIYQTTDNKYKAFVLIPIMPSISYTRYL